VVAFEKRLRQLGVLGVVVDVENPDAVVPVDEHVRHRELELTVCQGLDRAVAGRTGHLSTEQRRLFSVGASAPAQYVTGEGLSLLGNISGHGTHRLSWTVVSHDSTERVTNLDRPRRDTPKLTRRAREDAIVLYFSTVSCLLTVSAVPADRVRGVSPTL
jgi:hypothetical protein